MAGASRRTAVTNVVCTQAVLCYIGTVPPIAKWTFLNNTVYESGLCVCSGVCPPVLSIMLWTAAESVWRQPASERHLSRMLPSWSTHEHMHRNKCSHIYHQICQVPVVNNIYSMYNTHTHTHITFFSINPARYFGSNANLLLFLFRVQRATN